MILAGGAAARTAIAGLRVRVAGAEHRLGSRANAWTGSSSQQAHRPTARPLPNDRCGSRHAVIATLQARAKSSTAIVTARPDIGEDYTIGHEIRHSHALAIAGETCRRASILLMATIPDVRFERLLVTNDKSNTHDQSIDMIQPRISCTSRRAEKFQGKDAMTATVIDHRDARKFTTGWSLYLGKSL